MFLFFFYFCNDLVTKDLTGFELPPLPVPKSEPEAENSKEAKPDLKEFLYSLVDQAKEQLDSLKKNIFNDKKVSLKIYFILLIFVFNTNLFF